MRKLSHVLLFLCVFAGAMLFISTRPAAAQEKAGTAASSDNSTAKKLTAAKTAAAAAVSADADKPINMESRKQTERDGPEELRRRAEWFYKQRATVNGRIPSGARGNALRHMQNMMLAEGKIKRRADGTLAELSLAETAAAAFPAWTAIGPTPTTGGTFSPVSGRVTTIAVDPSDSTGNTVLIGGAQGGIWRSTDAGATWIPVGDQNASLSMGSIAFAPSNPSIVYAGTGEQESIAFDIYYGAGVLKSNDHGQTWTQTCTTPSATCPFIGPYSDATPFGYFTLGGTRISYVAVNPSNPQMVLVGAETQFAEGTTEGVYCSDNGGSTWTNILPDQMSTFVGFASATTAYAALGNTFGSSPGAPNGNGIYKATAIGATCSTVHFTRLTAATLPTQSSIGRVDIGIAPSDSTGKTLYASIADGPNASAGNLGVFLSTDGGTSWTKTNAPDLCQPQCWYDNVVKVDPQHAGTVFLGGSAATDSSGNPLWVERSTNSGTSWSSVIPALVPGNPGLPHVDNHAMAFVTLPNGKVRMYLGNDGGVWRTDDAEALSVQWTNLNNTLTLTQFYPAISIPASTPFFAIAGTQDNGTQEYSGSANWVDTGDCGDGTGTAIDALVPSSVFIACNGDFLLASYQNGALGTFNPAVNGINPADDSNFVPPFTADSNNGNTLYLGTTKIYQTVDGANSWTPISNDLVSPGSDVLTAIAVAPGAPQVMYAASASGSLFITTSAALGSFGAFTPVAITPRAITAIAIDPADATGGTVYVASSGFSYVNSNINANDPLGHIFKRIGFGSPWIDVSCSVTNCSKPAATDLPNVPVNDLVVDPDVPGTLYAATDVGVFIGNCGLTPCTWSTLSSGLPRVAVLSLRLHEPSRTLRAATHGRGAWDLHLNNFTFSGPHLSAITAPTPASAGAGGAQFTLTVSGSGLTGGTIQFGGTALAATGAASDTTLSGIVPTSLLSSGTVPVTVKVSSASSNALPFPILGGTPTLTSITPSSTPVQANPSANVTIQLAGTNFGGNTKVLFNGAPNGITVLAPGAGCALPTCLKATLPAALLGPFGSTDDISVFVPPPGGGPSGSKPFKVAAPPPPNDNIANAINITTLNFLDIQDSSGATTEPGDPVPPCVTQFSSANGNTGGHANGDYNTIWYKFTPQFSANLAVDTSGGNYDTVLAVWSGAPGSLTNIACNDDVVAGTQIQSQLSSVALTAGTTYYIMVGSFGPPDSNPIALGGRSSLNFTYNSGFYPAGTITSLSPSSEKSGDPGFTLTVNGSSFLSGASVVFIDPFSFGTIESTTFVNSTQLTASIPASAFIFPGMYSVSVNNPVPSPPSNWFSFTVNSGTYPVPTLDYISPNNAIAGSLGGLFVTAGGSNFASSAVINFNGTAIPSGPAALSRTAMLGTIPASALTTPGTYQVTVSNPTPGGGPSNSVPFTVVAGNPTPTITSLSPASVQSGTSPTVMVNGTGFVPRAAVCLNFPAELVCSYTTNYISSTQVSVNLSLAGLAAGSYPLYVVDPAPGGTSAAFNITVTGPPDFSVASSGTTSVTVPAGTTANFSNAISIAVMNGFSAAVSLSCSTPINATGTHCTVTPNSFPNGSGTASVAVSTLARGLVSPPTPRGRIRPQPLLLPVVILATLLLLWRSARTRRQRFALLAPTAGAVLFLLMQISGCGGGGGGAPPPPPPTGTPVGTYVVTVTATSGNLTHTTTLSLTVQ